MKIKNILRKAKGKIIVGLLVISAFGSFSFVDNYFELSKNLDIFSTLIRELDIYYVDETKPGDLMKKAIDSMLEELDPYTNYIPESEIEDARYMITGQYGGIGAMIRTKGDYAIISEPYDGYPAQKSDLRAGDMILEINGTSAKAKSTDEISKLLKGQAKTEVKLLIQRDGEAKPIEKILVREDIKIKNVSYYGMVKENTGYIKLSGFTEDASNEVKNALADLKKNHKVDGVILDLRGNPGGLLREAVDIVNLFVEKDQEVVSTKGKVKDWDKSHKAMNAPIDLTIPLTLLVDKNSASASEIVSGAIQDLDRGVIIGQRTFGKGLVQQTRPLSYNSQLKVTVAKYYIPSGRCIQALDYSHRHEDGSVDKVADSLMTAFKTKNGRIVYDGGGIAPDIALENKKFSNIISSLISKGYIFDYANEYRKNHISIPAAKDFNLSDVEYNDFVTFLNGKEYDYTTKSEKDLEEFKENAEQEKYYDKVKTEYEALKNKIIHNKKEDLVTFKTEVKQFLESEIASRYYFQKGRLEANLKYDSEITEAVAILNDAEKYKSVLTTITKAERPFNSEVINKTKGIPAK